MFAKILAIVLLLFASASPALAYNRHVLIRNYTSQPIYHVYASNVDVTSWQEDMLGDSVIMPGKTVNFNIDDGLGYCLYDLKVVMKDGTKLIKENVNVCVVETWTITD
jgi:hypothetical protein